MHVIEVHATLRRHERGAKLTSSALTGRGLDRKSETRMPTSSGACGALVFDEVLDGVLIVGDDRRYIDANEAACALFGVPPGGLDWPSIEEFAPAPPNYDADAAWNRFVARGHTRASSRSSAPTGRAR